MFTFEFNYTNPKLSGQKFRSALRWATWKEAMTHAVSWAEVCHVNGEAVAISVVTLED